MEEHIVRWLRDNDALVCIAGGVVLVVGAVRDWDWLCDPVGKAPYAVLARNASPFRLSLRVRARRVRCSGTRTRAVREGGNARGDAATFGCIARRQAYFSVKRLEAARKPSTTGRAHSSPASDQSFPSKKTNGPYAFVRAAGPLRIESRQKLLAGFRSETTPNYLTLKPNWWHWSQ